MAIRQEYLSFSKEASHVLAFRQGIPASRIQEIKVLSRTFGTFLNIYGSRLREQHGYLALIKTFIPGFYSFISIHSLFASIQFIKKRIQWVCGKGHTTTITAYPGKPIISKRFSNFLYLFRIPNFPKGGMLNVA